MGKHNMPIFKLDLEHRVRELINYDPFDFDHICSRHLSLLLSILPLNIWSADNTKDICEYLIHRLGTVDNLQNTAFLIKIDQRLCLLVIN